MSNQQVFLTVLVVLLIGAAVPGFFMASPSFTTPATPDQQQSPPSSSPKKFESQVIQTPDGIPSTSLNLQRSSKSEREKIKYARKININKAGNKELQTIPGVGKNTAESILNYRKQGNVFYRIEDLDQIDGIGKKTVEDLRPYVTVGKEYLSKQPKEPSTEETTINVNTADQSELAKLSGIGSVTARRIIQYREKHGSFDNLDELNKVSGIGPATIEKIRDRAVTY